jgi:hypothetical protein
VIKFVSTNGPVILPLRLQAAPAKNKEVVSAAATAGLASCKKLIWAGLLVSTIKSTSDFASKANSTPLYVTLKAFDIIVFGGVAANDFVTTKNTKSALKSALGNLNSS